jgi:hypothetical protein
MAIGVGGAELDSWVALWANPVDLVLMRGHRGFGDRDRNVPLRRRNILAKEQDS